jgi:hypothetical protein
VIPGLRNGDAGFTEAGNLTVWLTYRNRII